MNRIITKLEQRAQIGQMRIDDGFWNYYKDLVLQTVIPYQEEILNDRVSGAEKSHALENLRIAAGRAKGEFYGAVFQDSDVAKWAEAVSNAIAISEEEIQSDRTSVSVTQDFADKMDQLIDLIAAAQEEDGYLDTYFQIMKPSEKWTNLQEAHELYCMGHMIEAAVAHFEATGNLKFLNVGKKMADCIERRFGVDKVHGIPGHPEIELALMRLYHVTGEKRYLQLAKYFIDDRGMEPNYFAEEKKVRKTTIWNLDPEDRSYAQNRVPVRKAGKAEGHAVRAAYLYAAMADLASEIDDMELAQACERLWFNIADRQMYITGSVGQTVKGEAFTDDYDLPNDTVYAETCAAVAMIFFTRRMLQMRPCRKYGDVMERILYNGMLSGMQHDGKRFFYVNPLEVDPAVDGNVAGYEHIIVQRPQWYACACCPPNVARLITSLPRYAWGENENTIYSHLFLGGTYDSRSIPGVKIVVRSQYPWKGEISYKVEENFKETPFTLAVRIPEWARNEQEKICCGSEVIKECSRTVKDGYLYVTRTWKAGDELVLTFDMPVRRIYANTKVRKDAGLVCLMRGPVVYAMEEADNGKQLWNLALPCETAVLAVEKNDPELGFYVALNAEGIRYEAVVNDELYSEEKPAADKQPLVFIPYYLWGNRMPGEMRVWVQEKR